MINLIEILLLPPIQRALIVFLIAGISFPMVGVFIVVLNLVPLRFALMHGVLLGGVIGILLNMNNILFPLLFNLIIIILLGPFSEKFKIGLSNISAFFMITSIAFAYIIIDKANIPAMEAFSIFWGNIYALTNMDVLYVVILTIIVILFIIINFKKITAILFDMDIAYTSGINNRALYYSVLILTGIVVALSIKIIGALLADCLLLLPAMASLYFSRSIKGLFINSALIGITSALFGFIISLIFKLQPSPSVTIVSIFLILIIYVFKNFIIKKEEKVIQ